MAESGRTPQARALLQQCLHARLQVRPAEGDTAAQWVEVTSALRSSHPPAQGRFLRRRVGDLLLLPPPFPASFWEPAAWLSARAVGGTGLLASLPKAAHNGLPVCVSALPHQPHSFFL